MIHVRKTENVTLKPQDVHAHLQPDLYAWLNVDIEQIFSLLNLI